MKVKLGNEKQTTTKKIRMINGQEFPEHCTFDIRYSKPFVFRFAGKAHYFGTHDEMIRYAKDFEHKMVVQRVDVRQATVTNINSIWNDFIEGKRTRGRMPQTLENDEINYRNHIKNSKLAKMPIADITPHDVQLFVDDLILNSNLALATIKHIRGLVKACLDVAVQRNLRTTNPALYVMYPLSDTQNELTDADDEEQADKDEADMRCLTLEQTLKFIAWLKQDKTFSYYALMIEFQLQTGLRGGELFGIRREKDITEAEILIGHQVLQERTGKKRKYVGKLKTPDSNRKLPTKEIKHILAEYDAQIKWGIRKKDTTVLTDFEGKKKYSGFMFTRKHGGVFSINEYNKILERIEAKYNKEETKKAQTEGREPELLPHLHSHIFRHTFASIMANVRHMPLARLAYLLGHGKNTATTEKYYLHLNEDFRQEIEMDDILKLKEG